MNKLQSPTMSFHASTMGLKVEGDEMQPTLIQVDSKFEKCPIAHAAGIPLYVKRLLEKSAKKYSNYIIVRMMSQPSVGLAPFNWQFGGLLGPAPPVLVARSDQIQFNISDWHVLDDFEMEMLDDGPRSVTRKDFIQFVKAKYADNTATIVLEVFFPKGTECKVHGLLKNAELNGKIGTCNGVYSKEKVGVQFEGFLGAYALQPKNLQIVQKEEKAQQSINFHSSILLPPVISVEINYKMQKLWLQKGFYANNFRLAIYAFDYPELYDVITYNLPHEELAFNEVIVPVSDRHKWKLQLLKLSTYFEDTGRRTKAGYIDCQIWKLKRTPEAHRQCLINKECTCEKQK